ncbi:MAG: hypothetical protein ACYDCF_10120 [Burkholderiales bacterium]
MTTLSSLIKANQIPAVAGAPIAQNNLVQIGPSGKATPCSVSDYSAIANAASAILGATTTSSYNITVGPHAGMAYSTNSLTAQDGQGNLFVLGEQTNTSGPIAVWKYSSAGAFLQSYALPSGSLQATISVLSNGNLLVVWYTASGQFFTVLSPSLLVVVAATSLTAYSSAEFAAISLPGGGFAVCFTTAATSAEIAVYSNAGVLAGSATIASVAAVCGLLSLSNGNVAVVYENATNVMQVAVYTTVAALAFGPTSTGVTAYGGAAASMTAMTGYFGIAFPTGNTTPAEAFIFSNNAVLQGAGISAGQNSSSNENATCSLICNDGVNFWFVTVSATYSPIYSQISSAGVLLNQFSGAVIGTSTSSTYVAVFDSASRSIFIASSVTTTTKYSAFSVDLLYEIESAISIAAGSTATGSDSWLTALGDGAFFFVCENNTAQFVISIWKGVNTAIIGAAQAAAASGATVGVITAPGYFQITGLKGSTTKSFNMNSTSGSNLIGNKGVMAGVGISQLGIQ